MTSPTGGEFTSWAEPGDELEFRDVFQSVRVVVNVVSPSLLEVTVPFGLGPG